MLRVSGWVVVVTLVSAAAYELALALGAGSLGPEPGDGVAGDGIVKVIALLAMIAAAVLGAHPGSRPWPAALFAPSAAAFLLALSYTYDPYYAPDLQRYTEGVSVVLVVVTLVALVDGFLTARQPGFGRVMTPLVLVAVLLMALFTGTGH
jgi:hypothetical protein